MLARRDDDALEGVRAGRLVGCAVLGGLMIRAQVTDRVGVEDQQQAALELHDAADQTPSRTGEARRRRLERPLLELEHVLQDEGGHGVHVGTVHNEGRWQLAPQQLVQAVPELDRHQRIHTQIEETGRVADLIGELAGNLPADLLTEGSEIRSFYKEAVTDFLPRAIIDKPKQGFGLPMFQYVAEDSALAAFFCDALSDLKQRPFFRSTFLEQLIIAVQTGSPGLHNGIAWDLAVLETWMASRALS